VEASLQEKPIALPALWTVRGVVHELQVVQVVAQGGSVPQVGGAEPLAVAVVRSKDYSYNQKML